MNTLDPKNKRAWLLDLRSGAFKQAKGFLRVKGSEEDGSNDAFCCLGLFCEILDPDRWCMLEHTGDSNSVLYSFTDEDECGSEVTGTAEGEPEGDMYDLMGLDCDTCATLICMNDGVKYSRPESGEEPDEEIVIVEGIEYLKPKRPRTFSEIADYIEEHL